MMKKISWKILASTMSAFAVFSVSTVNAAEPMVTLEDEQRPIRISGVGIRVSDIEASMKFYTEVLGLKVGARIPREGPAFEYLLGTTGNVRADTLVVIRTGEIVPGATEFGNIVIVVPNGRAMAERVVAAGYPQEKIVDGTNHIHDPDGYKIELYQRPN